ncbi:MAG: universal stress protein, partial [Gammaproteobacteria bacterium]
QVAAYSVSYAEFPFSPDILDQQRQIARENADKAAALFQEKTTAADVGVEWRCEEGRLIPTLGLHARHADLTIVGQDNADDPDVTTMRANEVVLECGRPVLLTPYIGTSKPIGKRILVAWNGSREATRALNDAIPIMKRAQLVKVLAVNPDKNTEGPIPSGDICLHLARHDIAAEAEQVTAKDMNVGDILLSRASDWDVDLIVMGAYGHSRFREIILGGATRHLLQHMTVPTFVSH